MSVSPPRSARAMERSVGAPGDTTTGQPSRTALTTISRGMRPENSSTLSATSIRLSRHHPANLSKALCRPMSSNQAMMPRSSVSTALWTPPVRRNSSERSSNSSMRRLTSTGVTVIANARPCRSAGFSAMARSGAPSEPCERRTEATPASMSTATPSTSSAPSIVPSANRPPTTSSFISQGEHVVS